MSVIMPSDITASFCTALIKGRSVSGCLRGIAVGDQVTSSPLNAQFVSANPLMDYWVEGVTTKGHRVIFYLFDEVHLPDETWMEHFQVDAQVDFIYVIFFKMGKKPDKKWQEHFENLWNTACQQIKSVDMLRMGAVNHFVEDAFARASSISKTPQKVDNHPRFPPDFSKKPAFNDEMEVKSSTGNEMNTEEDDWNPEPITQILMSPENHSSDALTNEEKIAPSLQEPMIEPSRPEMHPIKQIAPAENAGDFIIRFDPKQENFLFRGFSPRDYTIDHGRVGYRFARWAVFHGVTDQQWMDCKKEIARYDQATQERALSMLDRKTDLDMGPPTSPQIMTDRFMSGVSGMMEMPEYLVLIGMILPILVFEQPS